jgi:fructokinase
MEKVTPNYYIGLETGGTNIKCIVASDPFHVISELNIPTQEPEQSIEKVIRFIQAGIQKYQISIRSMGIASFGPVDLNTKSKTYGYITSTPKLAWRNYPLFSEFSQVFDFPIVFDTDVNAATLGEAQWGEGHGLSDFVYITIGTGIGGGIITNNRLVHGVIHPEIGHMLINHDRILDPFPGACPYHKDCLEGLANGPSIAARWGNPAETLPHNHQAWSLEANYLAQMAMNLTLILSPQKIILGGGVSQKSGLIQLVRESFQHQLKEYMTSPLYKEEIGNYIVSPKLGQNAGVFGALALAQTFH